MLLSSHYQHAQGLHGSRSTIIGRWPREVRSSGGTYGVQLEDLLAYALRELTLAGKDHGILLDGIVEVVRIQLFHGNDILPEAAVGIEEVENEVVPPVDLDLHGASEPVVDGRELVRSDLGAQLRGNCRVEEYEEDALHGDNQWAPCYVEERHRFPIMHLFLRSGFRNTLLMAILVGPMFGFAQGKFTVNGRMKVEGGSMEGARAVVYKDGVKERTITTSLAKFTLDLGLNSNYVISFERDGFVSKKISFNTSVPGDAVANGFTPFDFAVSLFKQYDDVNIVVFNQPVGVIRYEPSVGDFDYDTDYTKSIQSQLNEVVEQVEKKKKEEQERDASKLKQEAEAIKAKQRAEEEAREQAAAQQAAEAKAKAEADRQTAAQQAAQAKVDAENQRKAQAEAKAEEVRQVAARREEEKRKAAEAAAASAVKPVPPAPEPKKERTPPAPPPVPVRNSLASKPNEGQDGRRTSVPVMVEEASRMAKAVAVEQNEERPAEIDEEPIVNRTEDLLVESGKVTTVVKLESEGVTTEYRRVYHKWGGTFFFKNGATCTQQVYENEALAPQLAGASPRGKLD